MEWNAESVLDALNDFERKSEIPEILDQYLERIAKNGEIVFPWIKLKPLLKKKLEIVLDEFYETFPVETSVPVPNFETFNFDNLKKTILQAVDAFTSAPFTIQRLCELVTNPTKHYNRTDKYMRGIEKNVLVVSTIEPRSGQGDGSNANNPVVNGLLNDSPRDDNDTLNGHESTDSVSSSNINTPSNHVLLENFANVFPSAACIPPSSNVCDEREVDNNFMASGDNSEQELAPVEQIESTSTKEEEMDTTEDEQFDQDRPQTSVDMGDVISGDVVSPKDVDITVPEKSSETSDSLLELSTESKDGVSASESVQSEPVCSDSKAESLAIPDEAESVKPKVCHQDDTISQSDDNSHTSAEDTLQSTEVSVDIDEVPDVVNEDAEYINEVNDDISKLNDGINKLDDLINKVADVIDEVDDDIVVPLQEFISAEVMADVSVSESVSSETSEQCMELESSTSSDLPEPPV